MSWWCLAVVGAALGGPFDGSNNYLWTHPRGDVRVVPCTHLVADGTGGAPTRVPCSHLVQQHPGGHDTGAKRPCTHLDRFKRPQHAGGDPIIAPCAHLVAQHPEVDPGPSGPPRQVPLHPRGDQAMGPCVHPLQPSASTPEYKLYFTDPELQATFNSAFASLKSLGINVGRPRPLHVTYHDPLNGDPNDDRDPFWSHNHPLFHVIQETKGRPVDELCDTLRHELGHALVGQRPVRIQTCKGSHTLQTEREAGLAMSEGWAHLVAMMLRRSAVGYMDLNWEQGQLVATYGAAPNVRSWPYSIKNEFRVGCMLWDVFDATNERKDAATVSFKEMFRVYSPTLATLREGPVFTSIDDYFARLKANLSSKGSPVPSFDAIRALNLTKP